MVLLQIIKWNVYRYRWFAVLYLVLSFLLFPLVVFGLSSAGWKVLTGIGVPVIILITSVITINLLQARRPEFLPPILQNWNFLPVWLTSLQPMDDLITRVTLWCGQTRGKYSLNNTGHNYILVHFSICWWWYGILACLRRNERPDATSNGRRAWTAQSLARTK